MQTAVDEGGDQRPRLSSHLHCFYIEIENKAAAVPVEDGTNE